MISKEQGLKAYRLMMAMLLLQMEFKRQLPWQLESVMFYWI